MNLENIGRDCPCYEVDCSDVMFDIGEFCGLPPNNGKLTIQVNGSTVGDFSANQQEDETINITTPTSQDIENAVAGEALLRQQADNTLQANIDAEELARQRADRDIQAVLDGESLARVNADRDLQGQIDAIASKSDVVDVVGTYAELQAYDTSKLNDNDVVKVLDDSTHNDSMTYYRWNKTAQTWSYIGQESRYYSKSQTDSLLAQKQDNLTAGTGITLNGSTISADTTVLAEKSELNNYAEKSELNNYAEKSELDNYAEKANTYTKTEVDNLVEPKLSVEVVEQLPVQGEQNKLYLAEKSHTTQTATGNPITATVSEDVGQIEDFQLDGDTYQQSYNGTNLYNATPYSSALQGITTTITDGYIFSYSGTTTTTYANLANWTSGMNLPAGTYTFCIDRPISTRIKLRFEPTMQDAEIPVGSTSTTFTTTAVIASARLFIITSGAGIQLSETGVKINLVAGSTAPSSFEPYVGGIASPNPDYPQPIQVVTGEQTVSKVGKNLFDKNNANIYHYNPATQGQALQPLAAANTVFVKVQPNMDITVSSTDRSKLDGYASVIFISGEPEDATTWITRTTFGTSDSVSVTSPANATYVGVYAIYSSTQATIDASLATIQIEYGSSATTYTPYSKTNYPISLGSIELCKLGTYQDYIWKDGDSWKVHKATGKFVFTNAITDGLSKQSLGFVYNTSGNPLVGKHTPLVGKCSHFDVEPTTTTWTALNKTGMNSAGALWFRTTDTNFGDTRTSGEFAQWLVDVGASYVYALATPTDTEITDSTLISQLNAIASASLENGTNTLTNSATGSNLAGDMEIGYFGYDPTNRYDKWLWLDINNAYEKLGS